VRVALGLDRARATERAQQGRAAAEEARRLAERANRAKDQFLAVVSHELRVPLNAILGWARILRTSSTTPETVVRAAEAIERSARIQTELVDDLLDVSRIVTGKMALDLRRIDVAEVVDGAIDTISRAAADKGVIVTVTVDPTAVGVRGDARRLRQVFTNLLENAVKFSLPDGAVTVRIVAEAGWSVVHIEDAGIGIAADAVAHVFDPFYQEEPFVPHATGGLGLGLAIVRGVVELHGGTVQVSSAGRGQGATFSVRLPAAGR
jgi:signal transduction histidine kinase